MDMFNEMPEVQGVILCASSAYEEKYYFNQEFANVPPSIQDELKILCVLYTADIGGILVLHFDEKGITLFNTLDDPTVLMDISSLTQLFFGTYGARELKDAGFIHVEEESSLWTLETLFPKKVNFINEYF
mgnify:CR=1 FL=1